MFTLKTLHAALSYAQTGSHAIKMLELFQKQQRRAIVQGIYEILKADLKLIATELLLSPKGRYKCPKQDTKSTKKSHWWNLPNFASKMA